MAGLTPASVSAQMLFADDARRVDRQASVTIQFENNAVASLGISGDSPIRHKHYHIWGEKGAAYLDNEEWDSVRLRHIDANGDELYRSPDEYPERDKLDVFIDIVRNKTDSPATARAGRRVDVDLSM